MKHVGDPYATHAVGLLRRDAHRIALVIVGHGGRIVHLDDRVARCGVDVGELVGRRVCRRYEICVPIGKVVVYGAELS